MEKPIIVSPFQEMYVPPDSLASTSVLGSCMGAGFYDPRKNDGYLIHWILSSGKIENIAEMDKIFSFKQRPEILETSQHYFVLLAGMRACDDFAEMMMRKRSQVREHLLRKGFRKDRIIEYFNEPEQSSELIIDSTAKFGYSWKYKRFDSSRKLIDDIHIGLEERL